MQQFVAILKDSFREAVDGFVIYAMLALSGLLIVLLASVSFAPEPPERAFGEIVQKFPVVLGGKGGPRDGLSFFPVAYKAADVRPEGDGFRLRVVAEPLDAGSDPLGPVPKAKDKDGDTFRDSVRAWERSDAPAAAVTDEQMTGFVRHQFATFAALDATVARVPGADPSKYEFDVRTSGGSSVRGWPHKVSLFFGAWTLARPFTLGRSLFFIQDQLVNGLGAALALLISVVITAFFIPNLLRKGSLDLIISKPIGRSQLLVYKYIGGLTFTFLVTAFTVGGVWLVLGARSGVWNPKFLIVIPMLTFTFAILYAVSTLAAVFTRSAIVAILMSVGFAVFLYIVGQVKSLFDLFRADERTKNELPEWAFTLVDTLNNVLPRYKDLDKLTTKVLSEGVLTPAELQMGGLSLIEYPSWGSTFGVSLAFIALMLALSCWRLNRRDS